MTVNAVPAWTGQLAVALQHALRLSQEAFAAKLGVWPRTVAKWHERPDTELRPATKGFLDTVLAGVDEPTRERFAILAGLSQQPELVPATALSVVDPAEVFMSAANEASADALLRSGHLGPGAMPELVQHVMHVARSYNSESRMAAFRHARATRDLAVQLTERTRRPSEITDLYVTIGETNALMASLAFDLGKWDASEAMARAATTYAEMAGHTSLQAWTLGLEATLAFWRGEGAQALDRIGAGLAVAPRGVPRFRLRHIASRAYAVLGDREGARRVLAEAEQDREDAEGRRDELHDVVAGEFRFGDARAAACAGTTWLTLNDGDQAAHYTRRTLQLHEQDKNAAGLGILSGARIDTAAALLLSGDLDEARAHIEPVLSLDADADNVSLGVRLANVRSLLRAGRWAKHPAALDLAGQVDGWLRGADALHDSGQ